MRLEDLLKNNPAYAYFNALIDVENPEEEVTKLLCKQYALAEAILQASETKNYASLSKLYGVLDKDNFDDYTLKKFFFLRMAIQEKTFPLLYAGSIISYIIIISSFPELFSQEVTFFGGLWFLSSIYTDMKSTREVMKWVPGFEISPIARDKHGEYKESRAMWSFMAVASLLMFYIPTAGLYCGTLKHLAALHNYRFLRKTWKGYENFLKGIDTAKDEMD